METNTLNQDVAQAIKDREEKLFATTHEGCLNWIEYFNTHKKVLVFGTSDRRTLEKANLRAIVKNIVRSIKFLDRRTTNLYC